MKKVVLFSFFILSILTFGYGLNLNYAFALSKNPQDVTLETNVILSVKYGILEKGQNESKIVLIADKVSEVYYDNVKIEIYDAKTKTLLHTIKPNTNYGYEPSINLFNFKDDVMQIFYGANSGGSGAFGFYYIYGIENSKVKTFFDYETFESNLKFSAVYLDNYKLQVTVSDKDKVVQSYLIDISNRGKDYLSQIYNKDGKLKEPTFGDVSAVNSVLPYYSNSSNKFEILVLRRVTGLYSADSFGYLQALAKIDGQEFKTFYNLMGIN